MKKSFLGCLLLAVVLFLHPMAGAAAQAGVYLPAFKNSYRTLSVPTQVTKIGDTYFLVDAYHDRVLYSDSVGTILTNWDVLDYEYDHPHAIAGDGTILMVVDTDNNRVVTYRKLDQGYERIETLEAGNRPHAIVFDKDTGLFYVWSSMSGEMYRFRREADSFHTKLADVQKVPELEGRYTRSFTIVGDEIYLPSMGMSTVYVLNKKTFKVKKRYAVPSEIGGMVQLSRFGDYWYLTYSSDQAYDQSHQGIVRFTGFSDLKKGKVEDLTALFDGNAPYWIEYFDDAYYVAATGQDKMPGVLYSFCLENNKITNKYKIVQ
ncbi:MAG: hypothetical protein K5682_03685 [Lachnospiraceae bacterium]|nr:hypothetical protein [Lachnospiraceae bacterium]